jgi:hypothetical protein
MLRKNGVFRPFPVTNLRISVADGRDTSALLWRSFRRRGATFRAKLMVNFMSQLNPSQLDWHCYCLFSPVDHWFGAQSVEVALDELEAEEKDWADRGDNLLEYNDRSAADVRALWESAIVALQSSQLHWNGDGRWSLLALPDNDNSMDLIFCVKQAKRGDTFVVSPVALVHLEKYAEHEVVTAKV